MRTTTSSPVLLRLQPLLLFRSRLIAPHHLRRCLNKTPLWQDTTFPTTHDHNLHDTQILHRAHGILELISSPLRGTLAQAIMKESVRRRPDQTMHAPNDTATMPTTLGTYTHRDRHPTPEDQVHLHARLPAVEDMSGHRRHAVRTRRFRWPEKRERKGC